MQMPKTEANAAHHDFFDRFCSFWNDPSGERVKELIAPDATVHFTGAGQMTGSEYADWMGETLGSFENLTVTPLDYAGNGEMLYIAWEAGFDMDGRRRTYCGVDRFRIVDRMAVEEQVIFDSAVFTPEGRPGID